VRLNRVMKLAMIHWPSAVQVCNSTYALLNTELYSDPCTMAYKALFKLFTNVDTQRDGQSNHVLHERMGNNISK